MSTGNDHDPRATGPQDGANQVGFQEPRLDNGDLNDTPFGKRVPSEEDPLTEKPGPVPPSQRLTRAISPRELEGLAPGPEVVEEAARGPEVVEEAGSETGPLLPEWSQGDERLLKWLVKPQDDPFSNKSFNHSELNDIAVRLERFQKKVTKGQDLTNERVKALNATVEEIHKASTRLGRKDWLMLGIGALGSLAISAVFPPATVLHMARLFIHTVAPLYLEALG